MLAERRARELLASVVGPREAAMFSELGFIAVAGEQGRGGYAYLLYPQRPLVAYETESGRVLCEFCVRFREPRGRLPDADDVLAKWLALRADERGLISRARLCPPGRQTSPPQVRADIESLDAWLAP